MVMPCVGNTCTEWAEWSATCDAEPLTTALPLCNQLLGILQQDVAHLPLYYSVGNFLIQPYLRGAGSNTAFDHYWDGISSLAH